MWGTNTPQTIRDPRLVNRFDYDGDYGPPLPLSYITKDTTHITKDTTYITKCTTYITKYATYRLEGG